MNDSIRATDPAPARRGEFDFYDHLTISKSPSFADQLRDTSPGWVERDFSGYKFKCSNPACCPADSDGKPWGTLHGYTAFIVATDEFYSHDLAAAFGAGKTTHPDLGMVDHACGFDRPGVRGERTSLPCSSGDCGSMMFASLERGLQGKYRGFPAIVLEVNPFVIAYKRDGKWTIFSGASPEDFYAR